MNTGFRLVQFGLQLSGVSIFVSGVVIAATSKATVISNTADTSQSAVSSHGTIAPFTVLHANIGVTPSAPFADGGDVRNPTSISEASSGSTTTVFDKNSR
jgi:hypothetical protein